MKNTKYLLALTVASAIILVGCGGKPVHPIDPIDPIEEVQPKLEDISDSDSTKKSINPIHDDFIVHSNHILNLEYTPQYGFYEDRFEHVKSIEDAIAVEKAIKVIQSSLISEISNTLSKNPHGASDMQHINALQKGSVEDTPITEIVTYHDITSLIIIDKFDDAYMNEHHAIEGVTDFMVQLDAYEENLENAESVEEIIVTLFENDQFVVKLSPSSRAIESAGDSNNIFAERDFDIAERDFDNASALNLLDEYVDYFKTPKVKSIIEDALGQKF